MSPIAEPKVGFDPAALVRPAVHGLPAYTREPEPPTKPPREINLAWNESPYGPSPKARAALAAFDRSHRYPEFDARTLRAALGRYVDAPAEQIVAGAGLDDVLNTLATLLIDPGDGVIISEPTFGVYRPLFATHGGEVVDVPLRPGFALDAEGDPGRGRSADEADRDLQPEQPDRQPLRPGRGRADHRRGALPGRDRRGVRRVRRHGPADTR